VSAERLAAILGGSWGLTKSGGVLTVGKRTARFVRSEPRVTVGGQAVTLGAGPRPAASGWLIPEDFLTKGLPRLVPGVTAVARDGAVPSSPTAPAKPQVGLEELRYRSYPSYTRVVLETGAAVSHTATPGPDEILVRVPRLARGDARTHKVADGLVKEIRLEPAEAETVLRVVLETPPGEVKAWTLQDPFRVVVDVFRPKAGAATADPRPADQPLKLIVIDPGHGGHDAGASGPNGLQEKDVVLDVARRVARLAEDGLGVKVMMTRTADTFVPLRNRTQFANKHRADLFVSIHANAHAQSVSEGVEVFFLSSEASDKESRQLAAIENGVIQLENQGPKGDLLKAILWDLVQSEFQRESSHLAETVLDSMTKSLRLVPRGVKQAGFFVLGGATMPAILVEIGFLTNRKEEKKLGSAEHREAVARAIYAGLADYRRRHDQRLRTAVRAESTR
jgi:N-acetylmuramoyl-L-alanine amidase